MGKRAVLYRDESRSPTFDKGDYAIAAEWLEWSASDPNRPSSVPGDGVACLVNFAELRCIVAEGGVFSRPGGQQGEFTLEREEEADAQDWCR